VSFYEDLQFLRKLVGALTTGEITWATFTADLTPVPLTNKVKDLIDSLQASFTLFC
jgi:hypothetical protein